MFSFAVYGTSIKYRSATSIDKATTSSSNAKDKNKDSGASPLKGTRLSIWIGAARAYGEGGGELLRCGGDPNEWMHRVEQSDLAIHNEERSIETSELALSLSLQYQNTSEDRSHGGGSISAPNHSYNTLVASTHLQQGLRIDTVLLVAPLVICWDNDTLRFLRNLADHLLFYLAPLDVTVTSIHPYAAHRLRAAQISQYRAIERILEAASTNDRPANNNQTSSSSSASSSSAAASSSLYDINRTRRGDNRSRKNSLLSLDSENLWNVRFVAYGLTLNIPRGSNSNNVGTMPRNATSSDDFSVSFDSSSSVDAAMDGQLQFKLGRVQLRGGRYLDSFLERGLPAEGGNGSIDVPSDVFDHVQHMATADLPPEEESEGAAELLQWDAAGANTKLRTIIRRVRSNVVHPIALHVQGIELLLLTKRSSYHFSERPSGGAEIKEDHDDMFDEKIRLTSTPWSISAVISISSLPSHPDITDIRLDALSAPLNIALTSQVTIIHRMMI